MTMTEGASIYILLCADGSYYTGITRRPVEERVSEHSNGVIPGCFTYSRRPVLLAYSEHYDRIDEAVAAERRIKGWSRAKKEAYMRGDFDRLRKLAKRREAAARDRGNLERTERPSRPLRGASGRGRWMAARGG